MGRTILTMILGLAMIVPAWGAEPAGWKVTKTETLGDLKVSLSVPVLVARSPGYCWFPSLARREDGDLLALMSNYADVHTATSTAWSCWSADGGLTWSDKKEARYGDVALSLPGGDLLLMPYYLRRQKDALRAPCQVGPKGKRELKRVDPGVSVTGWPRPDRSVEPKLGLAGFVFNGQTVKLKDGSYLAALYGYFQDDKRYSLVAAVSTDGVAWKVRTVVAGADCKLAGDEGPCESAFCRLKDGRIMCVFRLGSGAKYGQCFSKDEGKTWSEPTAMDAFSVQPSLAVMKDGAVVLSGGRPGLFVWFNAEGDGKAWQRIDLLAHHNANVAAETIAKPGNTSSYTEVVALDESHLLVIYDRIPHSWSAIPKGSKETNSVWVVRLKIERLKP